MSSPFQSHPKGTRGAWLLPCLPWQCLRLRGQRRGRVWVLSPMPDTQHPEDRSTEQRTKNPPVGGHRQQLPQTIRSPELALATVAKADVFVPSSWVEAGPWPHSCQGIPGTVPARLGRGREVSWGGPSYCRTGHLQPPTHLGWWEQVGLGPGHQGAHVGGTRAEPSALQPTPTSDSLGVVLNQLEPSPLPPSPGNRPRLADPRHV